MNSTHILQGQVEQAYSHQKIAILGNIVNALITAYILRNQVDLPHLFLWVAALFLLTALRCYHTKKFRADPARKTNTHKWQNYFTLHLLLSGTLWGLLALFFFPHDSVPHQVFLAFIMGGMVIGAAASSSSLRPAYWCYAVLIICPLAIRFLSIPNEVHIALGALLLFFLFFCLFLSNIMYRHTVATLSLAEEKEQEISKRTHAEEALRSHQKELEYQIQERTEELETINENLREEIQFRQKAEEKYKIIFNSPNDAIFLHKPTGEITDVNQATLRMFGYSYEESLRLGLSAFSSGTPPYDLDHARKKVKDTVTLGPQVFEWEAKNKQGKVFWVEVSLKVTEFDRNKYVLAAVRDIHRRKIAEEKLRKRQEQYRLLFEKGNDGIILYETDESCVPMRFLEVNEKALTMLGYTREEFLQLPVRELILPEKRHEIKKSITQKQQNSGQLIYETTLVGKNGSPLDVEVNDHSFTVEEQFLALAIVRDIRQRKQLEHELYRNENLQSLGTLAGGIAHDFNNILTALFGNIELAKLTLHEPEKAENSLKLAGESLQRASALTSQLLTFSKGGEPEKQAVHLPMIIKDAALFALSGSKIQCFFECADDIPQAYVDKKQIEQVINHIVINAKEATGEEGTITVTIHTTEVKENSASTLPPGNYIQCDITDTGSGIPEENIGKIFDPYYSSKGRGNIKGTGLGLSICHSIISKHKGQISVISSPQQGTTFSLLLPTFHSDYEAEGWAITPPTPDTSHPDKARTVLILEDEPSVAQILVDLLRHFDVDCAVAVEGRQAVELYTTALESGNAYRWVILDLTIRGGMGGKKAAEEILTKDPNAYLVVSSGYADNETMINYRRYGFRAAIAKPFTIQGLRDALGDDF